MYKLNLWQRACLDTLNRREHPMRISDLGRKQSAALTLHAHGYVEVTVTITEKGRAAVDEVTAAAARS